MGWKTKKKFTTLQVYLIPLREDPNKYGIKKEEFQLIFTNIETIVNLHKELLKVLGERIANWSNTQKVGDIFIRYVCAFLCPISPLIVFFRHLT